MMNYMGFGMGAWMWPVTVVVLVVVGVAIFLSLRIVTRNDVAPSVMPSAPPRPSAVDVLDARLARGEIDTTEYERIRATLDAHS